MSLVSFLHLDLTYQLSSFPPGDESIFSIGIRSDQRGLGKIIGSQETSTVLNYSLDIGLKINLLFYQAHVLQYSFYFNFCII